MKDLSKVPVDQQEHYLFCPECGHYLDMRDLGQALHHGFGECKTGAPVAEAEYDSSRQIGQPTQYLKNGGSLDLN